MTNEGSKYMLLAPQQLDDIPKELRDAFYRLEWEMMLRLSQPNPQKIDVTADVLDAHKNDDVFIRNKVSDPKELFWTYRQLKAHTDNPQPLTEQRGVRRKKCLLL